MRRVVVVEGEGEDHQQQQQQQAEVDEVVGGEEAHPTMEKRRSGKRITNRHTDRQDLPRPFYVISCFL